MLKLTFGDITFSLTDDAMCTIIEDLTYKDHPKAIILNNLAICSLAERGMEFCHDLAATQPDKMFPAKAAVLNLAGKFFMDETMILTQLNTGVTVKVTYSMVKTYYEDVLCKIMLKEHMQDGLDFEKNYLAEAKKMKEDAKKESS